MEKSYICDVREDEAVQRRLDEKDDCMTVHDYIYAQSGQLGYDVISLRLVNCISDLQVIDAA